MIQNGDFENERLNLHHEKWKYTDYISGWEVYKGEIGLGSLYNSNWDKNTQLIELDGKGNSAYTTKFNGNEGLYEIIFDYAARESKHLGTS